MENGISTDQGSFTPYGLRDVNKRGAEQRQHDWSNPEDDKLAGAPNNEEINSLSTFNRKDGLALTSHNGANVQFVSDASTLHNTNTPTILGLYIHKPIVLVILFYFFIFRFSCVSGTIMFKYAYGKIFSSIY